jgi:hypothetical protein
MSNTASLRFSCNACNKSYAFKPELANKKVKCKCGAVMVVPDLSANSDDELYDIADEPKQAMPVAKPVGTAVSVALGGSAAATVPGKPRVLAYKSGPTAREREAARTSVFTDMYRDVYVPTGLIVASFVAFTVFTVFFDSAGAAGAAFYALGMGVVFFFKTLLMIGAAFILAPLLGVSFGPLWTAILKLAAVAMAPDVLATIITESIGVTGAGILANSIALAFYWFLIAYLFQLDASEAWYVVIGFAVLRWLLTIILAIALAGFLLSGRGSSIASVANSAASASPAASLDSEVDALKDSNALEEARAYVARGRQASKGPIVEKCYAAGAKNVWFGVSRDINGKTEPFSIIIEWPRDAAQRAAVLKEIRAYFKQQDASFKDEDFVDEGGKYAELEIE